MVTLAIFLVVVPLLRPPGLPMLIAVAAAMASGG